MKKHRIRFFGLAEYGGFSDMSAIVRRTTVENALKKPVSHFALRATRDTSERLAYPETYDQIVQLKINASDSLLLNTENKTEK